MSEPRVRVWVQRFADRPHLMLQWLDPDTGKRKSKSTGTDDPDAAEQLRSDKEYELNHGLHQEASRLDWDRFRQLFEEEYLGGSRARTKEKYGTVLDVFEQICNPTKLKAITERTISAFIKGMRERVKPGGKVGLAPWSIKNYLVAFKTAMAWAVEQKLLPALPKFPKIKVPKKRPQPVPSESFDKMLEKAPDDLWRAYLLCGWYAGLRLSEAAALRRDRSEEYPWVDFDADCIRLPAVFVKADEDQWVPLHPVLREALEGLERTSDRFFAFRSSNGLLLKPNSISHRVVDFAKAAGVKLSMHRLRKGFGCRVARQLGKGNAPILHRMMRHSSMQITMDFYASVDDSLHDAMNQLK